MPRRELPATQDIYTRIVGRKIKEARKKARVTQQMLGDALNVDRTTVTKWETGVSDIPICYAIHLCIILDMNFNELYAYSEIKELFTKKYPFVKKADILEMPDGYLTLKAWAIKNGTTDSAARQKIRKGKLPAQKFGNIWIIKEDVPHTDDRVKRGKHIEI